MVLLLVNILTGIGSAETDKLQCPECRLPVTSAEAAAGVCPACDAELPVIPEPVDEMALVRDQLRRVARAQRRVLFAVLAMVCSNVFYNLGWERGLAFQIPIAVVALAVTGLP